MADADTHFSYSKLRDALAEASPTSRIGSDAVEAMDELVLDFISDIASVGGDICLEKERKTLDKESVRRGYDKWRLLFMRRPAETAPQLARRITAEVLAERERDEEGHD